MPEIPMTAEVLEAVIHISKIETWRKETPEEKIINDYYRKIAY